MSDNKSETTYLLQMCPHTANLEKYNDDNKDFKYYVTTEITNEGKDRSINMCVLEISFYRYLKFVSGKLQVLNDVDASLWTSTKAVTFEDIANDQIGNERGGQTSSARAGLKLKYNDMEVLHNNLLVMFDSTKIVKDIMDTAKSSIDSISGLKSSDTLFKTKCYVVIKEFIDTITNLTSLVEHFELFNLTGQQKGLIIRNLFAYLLCSYTHVPNDIKNIFCVIFPEVYDEIWKLGLYFEDKIKTKWHCCVML